MADRKRSGDDFTLEVPLDASGIEDFKPEQAVKVVVRSRDGTIQADSVRLDAKGKGTATLTFAEKPGALRIVLGPETASDEELFHTQTIGLDLSARQWELGKVLKLSPIRIPAYYWHWWLWWCRTFTIRGRVLCPDGSPVPGAKVCAFDVDLWWWWSSVQEVGCDTTDANGSFEIRFRWCCGFWPWWWWKHRFWRLEPILADRIQPVLQRGLKLAKLPVPSANPNLAVFEELLAGEEEVPRRALPEVDPNALESLRRRLLERIPIVPELEQLHIWPWWPWHPWWDCTPDILFRVTQNCLGEETIIVDEGVGDTRWNISTTLDLTLAASDQACCVQPHDDPAGVCMVIAQVCRYPVQFIGGNPSAPAAPAGYLNPGVVAPHGDRPFAGVVPIRGLFGDLAAVDYYEFEWSDDGGATWNDMPPAAAGGFSRYYWGPKLGTADPPDFHRVPFSFTSISGRRVIESREHFEATNDLPSWGITRFWTTNRNLLMRWITKLNFPDGTYRLRVKSWDLDAGGNLVERPILPLCDTEDDNGIVLTIDNRFVGAGSGHPTAPDHPCGTGTVHSCTTEPDTDFLDVRINGQSVGACANVDASEGGQLEIDFLAHDPDGHLAYYTLRATYGENLAVNLLTVPSAVLTAGPGSAPVPPAAQVGPNYGDADASKSALSQGAVSPIWHGGAIRLTISNLPQAFPVTCCYQLELRAYKRTIDTCNDNWPHRNLSEFSLTVAV